jgi:putative phage-type endonuclease
VSAPVRIPVLKGTAEWWQARRSGVTSTDILTMLPDGEGGTGIDPWGKSESDVAREKLTGEQREVDAETARRFRLGTMLEAAVRAEDEIEHGIALRGVNQLLRHPTIPFALTSLDFQRVGERTIVEAKTTASRSRFSDGLPEDIEAQVRWQMGCAGYPRAHVAVLRAGQSLECFDLEHDDGAFAGMVERAADFWRRLAEGGPFAETAESLKRSHPADDGSEITAEPEIVDAVLALRDVRERMGALEAAEKALETAIKTRMADAARLRGDGWSITWKRTKDRTETDWKAVAADLLAQLPEPDRAAVVGSRGIVRPGFRPFRVSWGKGDTE